MTTDERAEEIQYRIKERLAIQCPEGDTTPKQRKDAWDEAVRDVDKIEGKA